MEVVKGLESKIEQIDIWGKTIEIFCFKGRSMFLIRNGLRNICPKCETPYSEPEHRSIVVCSGCKAHFYFAGALNPYPVGEVKSEIVSIAKKQGIDLQ